nr:immunoglobulin light chain junction region [Mus musculus]
CQQSNTFGTF